MRNELLKFEAGIKKALHTLEKKQNNDPINLFSEAIQLLKLKLQEAKIRFQDKTEANKEDEIYYIKSIKCKILFKIYYYKRISKIEQNKPSDSTETCKQYYRNELLKIKTKLAKFEPYQKYYLINVTELDQLFFPKFTKTFIIDGRPIAKKIANNFFLKFYIHINGLLHTRTILMEKIKQLKADNTNKTENLINWTATKTDLVELAYALHETASLNNGKSSIKQTINIWQTLFSIDLSQHNRIFHEIKSRKGNKTKYIEQLREALSLKTNKDD